MFDKQNQGEGHEQDPLDVSDSDALHHRSAGRRLFSRLDARKA
jgi:hypothetical protein